MKKLSRIFIATITAATTLLTVTPALAKDKSHSSDDDEHVTIVYQGYSGWAYKGTDWYYVNSDSTFKTGWYKEDGYIYYFNSDGKMVTGASTINGQAYYFSNVSDGHRGHLVPHKIAE